MHVNLLPLHKLAFGRWSFAMFHYYDRLRLVVRRVCFFAYLYVRSPLFGIALMPFRLRFTNIER